MFLTKREQSTIDRALNIIREKAPSFGDAYTSPASMEDYCSLYFAGKHDREHFAVVFLNNQHELIAAETLFSGTIDGAAVYPREVAKAALRHNAAAVVLSHNHPSGLAEPSRADKNITKRLCDALNLLEIRTLDHIITTPGGATYSFAQNGDM